MVTVAVELPPLLFAVIVYVADEDAAVGVPEIAPVVLDNARPAGSDGETVHDVGVPPLVVGVTVVIVVPFVRVSELGEYVIVEGAISLTWMVKVAVALPPALVAVTVYVPEEVTVVGVPLIVPFAVFRDRPAGRDGETDQEAIVPPLADGVTLVIAVPFVKVNELGV